VTTLFARPSSRSNFALLALLLMGLTSGCTSLGEYVSNGFKVGPNYLRPAAPVADDWIDYKSERISQNPAEYNWWSTLNDPVLDRIVVMAYQQNITLREAGFRVQEAQLQRAIAVGGLFPQTQQLFGDYTRTQRSTQTATFPRLSANTGFGNIGLTNFDNWRIGGNLAWELDFWGRYRRAIEAADARLDSSVENYDDVLVILIAESAIAYVDVRTAEQRLVYARANVALQQESARVAEARFNAAAVDSELDAPQAKSNLARTESGVEALEISKRQAENRLSVLLGMPPHDLTYLLGAQGKIPTAPESIAVGVPADLLRRRPDVRRAERLVAAQSAEIGIAESDLFPIISLNGTATMEAAKFSDLFNGGAFAGTVGPSFRWNVLNYGRLQNFVGVQNARFQQLVAVYQQTVLDANQEAEDAIVAFRRLHTQIEFLQQSVNEAADAVRVAQAKYRAGEIDFNRLFTVEQLLVSQQDQYAVSQGQLAESVIRIYRALGGGWEIRLRPLPQVLPGGPGQPAGQGQPAVKGEEVQPLPPDEQNVPLQPQNP
jgi:NodT family efflux transporter outer membrane factor (OMF) lipoprotein